MSGLAPAEEAPATGWVAEDVAAEFPELALRHSSVEARPQRSSRELRGRLADLSNRFRGAQAVRLRTAPVPHAYRVFYRHVGLDPDELRTPGEATVLERLMQGGFLSHGTVQDACTIALVETGVPVWALDRDRVSGSPGIRLGDDGRLVVADAARVLGVLFGDLAPGCLVGRRTERVLLFAVQVAGVPEIHVDEALWTCRETLLGG